MSVTLPLGPKWKISGSSIPSASTGRHPRHATRTTCGRGMSCRGREDASRSCATGRPMASAEPVRGWAEVLRGRSGLSSTESSQSRRSGPCLAIGQWLWRFRTGPRGHEAGDQGYEAHRESSWLWGAMTPAGQTRARSWVSTRSSGGANADGSSGSQPTRRPHPGRRPGSRTAAGIRREDRPSGHLDGNAVQGRNCSEPLARRRCGPALPARLIRAACKGDDEPAHQNSFRFCAVTSASGNPMGSAVRKSSRHQWQYAPRRAGPERDSRIAA